MALRELQEHSESRIAVLLGVPPYLVGLPAGGDSLTYASTVSIFQYHWNSFLEPSGSFITKALSNWALPLHTELNIDPTAYIRESMAVRGQFYQSMHSIGAMTIEEIRAAERFAPLEQTQPEETTDAA
jgi:phage portal protein BeeE